jgi:carbon-monoxide dehydrogenase iron sulfur subunit
MRGIRITLDPDRCTACRACELACSYHHSGLMSPALSSLQVSRDNHSAAIEWRLLPTCDLCEVELQPLCQRYCSFDAIRMETSA